MKTPFKTNLKMKNDTPQYHEPTREEVLVAMQELSKYFSSKFVLRSSDYSDLTVRGEGKSKTETHSEKVKIPNRSDNDYL